jgi:hypothetical protein
MKTRDPVNSEMTLAATVAGEDLRVGHDVALLNETFEFPSFLWDCSGPTLRPQDVVRIECRARDAGTPQRVRGICLPFVFLEAPDGGHRTIDLRRVQLVRLDREYARMVRKKLRAPRRNPAPPRPAPDDD